MIAVLANTIFEPQGQWPELLPFLLKLTKSTQPEHRESALVVFGALADVVGPQLRAHFAVLREVLINGLNDPQDLKVRIAALDATAMFMNALEQPHERAEFQQLLPLMLQTVSAALSAGREDEARQAIGLFIETAEQDAVFLKPHLALLINAMLTIGNTASLEDDTRQMGLEFLVTLAEARPAMVRKQPKFFENVLQLVLSMMLELEDDEDWEKGQDDDEVEVTNTDIGEESLDRLALALGGKHMVPILFSPEVLPGLLRNPSWKHRHTALIAISVIGEGCHPVLQDHLTDIVKQLLQFFADPHPRVRWAVCNTMGQMSTDFGPDFQQQFVKEVLPALMSAMDDASTRVQAHAAAAVINFCEHATKELLAPYLDTLLGKLIRLLQGGKVIVQEQAITAIAAVADCAEAVFDKYYHSFVPLLKSILSNALSKEYRMMRGKAMECISLIGVAVGKERFAADAKDVMEIMIRTQQGEQDPDDPQTSYIQQACARICKCLQKDFAPYMPHVMPALIAGAKIKPDITVNDADEEADEDREGWEFISLGDKQIGIHTSSLEEKYNACNTIYSYASELGDVFSPYVEEVSKIMVPLMRFYYHDGVRQAAVLIMPHLVAAQKEYLNANAPAGAADTYVRGLFSYMLPEFLESIKKEPDKELTVSHLEAFSETLQECGENILSNEQIKAISDLALVLMQDVHKRRHERKAKSKDEDHDEEEEERIEFEASLDDDILLMVAEVIGQVAKFTKAASLPHLQGLLPVVLEMLNNRGKPSTDRQAALCIFDDIVEHTGTAAHQLFPMFLPRLVEFISDKEPAVRQAAMFGAGVCAQFGFDAVKSAVPSMLQSLAAAINDPQSRTDVNVNPTENAIGAFGKFIFFQSGSLDVGQAFQQYLAWMPVTEDKVEAKATYAQFCTFLERDDFRPMLLGRNYENLAKVVAVFGRVLETDLINDAEKARIRDILKLFQATVPQLLQGIWGTIDAESQAKLMRCVA
eukprot:TRINITY_DN409_c0_g1_i1.p1 TRINITY_DN409_c0_g1~~TRINITY_DN409_c0_g1_i1.p1  ORF type:complete len:1122 (-),score=363.84 TRINITY_DN409_c0_g1_i1:247-3201(-)